MVAVCVVIAGLLLSSCIKSEGKNYTDIVRNASVMSMLKVIDTGDSLYDAGNYDEALVHYLVACNRAADFLTEQDKQRCGVAHLYVGNIYYHNQCYAKALEYYVKGLKIYESCAEHPEAGRFYNNIGNIYNTFQDYEKGMSYYETAYRLNHAARDTVNEYKVLVNMTGISTFLGKTKEAKKYYDLSEKIRNRANIENNFMSRFNLLLILMAEKQYAKSLQLARDCMYYSLAHKMAPRYLCSSYQYMYMAHANLNDNDSAMYYLDKCHETATRDSLLDYVTLTLKEYTSMYKENGNIRKAFECQSLYLDLTDSIYNKRDFDVVKNALFLYEKEQINKEIELLHEREQERLSTISRQRTTIAAVIAVVLILTFFIVVVIRQKRRLDRNYSALYEVNANSIAAQELMKQRLRHQHARIEYLEKELLNSPESGRGEETPAGAQTQDTSARRYEKSNLNDDLKTSLAYAISDIMENTTEYCSPDFSLDRLATLVSSNSKYVSQTINDTFHKNFSNFVNEYRIRLAGIRLADKGDYRNYTLRAIGESVGFKSYSSFTSVFRRITGLTPSVYQTKAREEALSSGES